MADPVESTRARTELWVKLAYALLASSAILLLCLGSRPAGVWPVKAWLFGPMVLAIGAIAVLLFALIWSATHRPFLTRSRMFGLGSLAIVIGGVNLPFPFPAQREGHASVVRFRLPVRGEWTVVWGGDAAEGNLLARMRADRRWGLDLLITRDGASVAGDGRALEAFFAFDQPVFAPCDGRVVRVKDGFVDHADPRVADDAEDELGNHIVIEVAPREFLFLCNLKNGSLRVREGESVAAGAELARVGNSGASPFTPQPHLALHLQDTPVPRWGQPIPWRFHDYEANGQRVESGLPMGGVAAGPRFIGQRVRSLEP